MRSSTSTRRTRRLLVTAGVLTLGLSVVSPTAVWASNAGGNGNGNGGGNAGGPNAADTSTVEETKTWMCHRRDAVATPWELNHVSTSSVDAKVLAGDLVLPSELVSALEEAASTLGLDATKPSSWNQLSDQEEAVLTSATCAVLDSGGSNTDTTGGSNTDTTGGSNTDTTGGSNTDTTGGSNTDTTGGSNTDTTGGSNTDTTGGDTGQVVPVDVPTPPAEVPTPPVEVPAAPVVDSDGETPRQPKPVIISTDQVEKPVEAPVVSEDEAEVLGVTTTRTPTSEVAGSSVQTLPRTGSDHTTVLVLAGGALVLAGLALELASRRTGVAGGQLPTS